MDRDFLKALTEAPSVGTACGPTVNLLKKRFGESFFCYFQEDSFCLFQKAGSSVSDLKVVLIAHLDEIGGCVYGKREEGGFNTRVWGNHPGIFSHAKLQAFDWLAQSGEEAFAVDGRTIRENDEERLIVTGNGIRSFRTVLTFMEETTFEGDVVEGKALDPRATLYSVVEAVRAVNSPHVGALLVMAEECAMDVARKAAVYLQREAPNLKLIANADVPGMGNLFEAKFDTPAIRIFEGRNFIDPSFGIRMAETLESRGVEFHLSAARSGSQTVLFSPLAPTLSIALPSEGMHLPRVKMSLTGIDRCQRLLEEVAGTAL